jgi:nitroreductase
MSIELCSPIISRPKSYGVKGFEGVPARLQMIPAASELPLRAYQLAASNIGVLSVPIEGLVAPHFCPAAAAALSALGIFVLCGTPVGKPALYRARQMASGRSRGPTRPNKQCRLETE